MLVFSEFEELKCVTHTISVTNLEFSFHKSNKKQKKVHN